MRRNSSSLRSVCRPSAEIPIATLGIFSAPVLAGFILQGPVGYLPGIFAKHYGLDLVALGAFFTVARLFDAFSDPVMGYLSDNIQTRYGRRKPWIGIGTVLTVFFGVFLFFPVTDVSVIYFGSFYLLLTFGQTLVSIPHNAWAVGLSHDYHQRTRVFFYIGLAQMLGSAIYTAAPLLPIFESTAFTPEVLRVIFLAGAAVSLVAVGFLLFKVPEPVSQMDSAKQFDWRVAWDLLRKNPPFLYFIALSFISAMGLGLYLSLGFIFFDTYLKIGDKVSIIGLTATAVSLVAMPLWLKLASLWDKRHVFVLGALGRALALIPFAFLTPGPDVFPVFIALTVLDSAIGAGRGLMIPSIKADIVDYGTWRTHADCAGTYMSFMTLLAKVEFSLAGGIGLMIAGLFGYNAAAAEQTDVAVFGIKLVHIVLPSILLTISAIMMIFFPIDRRRQDILRRRLAQRQARQQGMNHSADLSALRRP